MRVYYQGDIKNIHVIALPMFDRHTGDYMYELFSNLFDILDTLWKSKLVGITTDGARNMTGCHRGVVTRIQNEVLPEGFITFGVVCISWILWSRLVSQNISTMISIVD